ncbi:porin family protein [Vibrio sp. Of7-15]|uniref:outer membrane beta-barrel protein n=1 Tax=Vibrio sp. Of7-15 TaxID=2724879 RepID=UPI001EF1AB3B|nr:outer membrane beta-barrel protein [Vibrio sp. Of7-15]MCG7499580.1 porin family protein [Vibrio sp. Of7-15]
MNKCLFLALAAALSFPASAMEQKFKTQDVYLAASMSNHELHDKEGTRAALHFGVKNIYNGTLFYGGELEAAILSNDDFEKAYGAAEKASFSASIPFGVRLQATENIAFDLYGLAGYTLTSVDLTTKKDTIDGFRWGGGLNTSLSNFQLGVRYTEANLGGDILNRNITEKNISLLIGYKIDL